jgi:ADP-ribosylglycohydrolase
MIGAIIGDIAGAPYEMDKLGQDKRDYRPFFLNGLAKFTDDTNLTIAIADAILNNVPFKDKFIEWHTKNPDLGYGSSFKEWAEKGGNYVNESRGDGAIMRISPVVIFAQKLGYENLKGEWIHETLERKLEWALRKAVETTEPTHNCAEARNGAMAIVTAMILAAARNDKGENWGTKEEILEEVSTFSKYDLSADLETVRNTWTKRDIRCDITAPQALIAFRESTDFESAIRNSVYSKGDVDTIAAIAGGIAEWYYGVDSISAEILAETKARLQPEMIAIIDKCYDGKLKW